MTSRPTNGEALGLVAGFALWSLAFALFYGAHGAICSGDAFDPGRARMTLLAILVTMVIAHAGLILWFAGRLKAAGAAQRMVRGASLTLAIAALGATLWTAIPAVTLEIC